MIICVDIDGVLADFTTTFAAKLTAETGMTFPLHSPDFPAVWEWPKAHGVVAEAEAAVWREIHDSPTFWLELEPLPYAIAVVQGLYHLTEAGHEVYFVSDRRGRAVHHQTVEWLRRKDGRLMPTVVFTSEKATFARVVVKADYFIDDKWEHCRQVALPRSAADVLTVHRPRVYLKAAPYNRPYWTQAEQLGIKIVTSPTFMLDDIEKELGSC